MTAVHGGPAITWRITGAIWSSIVTRARFVGMLVAGALVIVVAAVVARSGRSDPLDAALVVDGLGLSLLVPAAALVFGTAALGDPIDDRTLVYLWLRPVSRTSLAMGAVIAAVGAATPLGVVPVVVAAWLVSGSSTVTASAAVAAVLASLASTCLFVLLGSRTQRALSWGIGYILIYEQFIARGGKGLGFFSVHAHAVSLVAQWLDVKINLDYFSAGTSVVVLVVSTLIACAATARRLRRIEVA